MTEGWAALRMRDLAAAVGIRAPSIYHHFATKADLGMAVVTHLHDETKAHIAKMSDGRASLKDRLAGFTELLEGPNSCSQSCPLYNLQAEFAVLPPDMQTGMSAVVNDILDEFARWISDAEATGEIAHVCHPSTSLHSVLNRRTRPQLRRVPPTSRSPIWCPVGTRVCSLAIMPNN